MNILYKELSKSSIICKTSILLLIAGVLMLGQTFSIFCQAVDLSDIPAPYNFGGTQKLENNDSFFVGGGGDFQYSSWEGKNFKTTIDENLDVSSVYFVNPQEGWVVGGISKKEKYQGWILKTNDRGISWILQEAIDTGLEGIYCFSSDKCWTVGRRGKILRTDNGIDWKLQNSNTTKALNSVYFLDESLGWSVGNYGTILRTNDGGINWRRVKLSNNRTKLNCSNKNIENKYSHLYTVKFFDNKLGWIGGLDGVFRTTDGGETWDKVNSNSSVGIVTQDGIRIFSISEYDENQISLDSGKSWKIYTPISAISGSSKKNIN